MTRAAARLRRVQSNVTTRIQQLEQALGVELFTRTGRSMVLTPAGTALLPYAERLLALASEARSALGVEPQCTRLRLGATESFAAGTLTSWLSRYRRLCPHVSIDLSIQAADRLGERLERFELDAVFAMRPAPCESIASKDSDDVGSEPIRAHEKRRRAATTACRSEAIGTDELVLVTAYDQAPVITACDLRIHRMAVVRGVCAFKHLALLWVAQGDVHPTDIVELESYHALFAWVAAGAAYAVVPRCTIGAGYEAEGLKVHPAPIARVDYLLVWRDGYIPRSLQALRSVLAD